MKINSLVEIDGIDKKILRDLMMQDARNLFYKSLIK
jgi:hypothetical protein